MNKYFFLFIICIVHVFFFLFLVCLVHFFSSYADSISNWTWLYRATFSDDCRSAYAHKKSLIFSQVKIAPFTQLIFSWNALRPEEGYFSFFAQVRDAVTK